MILLYDSAMRCMGPLRAIRVGYRDLYNELSTAELVMPAGQTQDIQVPGSYARLLDGDEDKGYYVFAGIRADEHAPTGTVTYELQRAEATLLRGMLAGWHEIGGTGVSTREVAEYILAGQDQWVLGECAFADEYQYNFQDVTRLEALFSLGEVLTEPYEFVFDSTSTPWTVHLRRAQTDSRRALVYRRNMTSIRRSVDGRVVTRLYGRGYGEGDNQMTIAPVNGGLDYIEDAEAAARYGGHWEGVHVDTRQTDPQTLLARMRRILEAGKTPQVSYEATAIDLARVSGESWDEIRCGDAVTVLDELLGAPAHVRVTAKEKRDMDGRPGEVGYTLDSSRADTADELNEILEKIGIQELYSQGATNMYSMQLSDNADAEHPLTMRFYVPGNVLRINSCIVYWQIERFRTYVTAIAAAASTVGTSQSGGGATVTIPAQTLSTGVTYSGGPVDTGDGSSAGLTGSPKDAAGDSLSSTESSGRHRHATESHIHNMASHTHASTSSGPSPATTYAASPATEYAGAHTHDFVHYHNMPHGHNIAHEHTIPALVFELSAHTHRVTVPEHTHEFSYGVFEGERAESLTLIVDGTPIPQEAIGEASEMDIAAYMAKDEDGKVRRGTWHECEFVPSGITRITADLFFQVFIQSRGAGDY